MQNTDGRTADILNNKKLQPMVTALAIRRTKTKIFLAITLQIYLQYQKIIDQTLWPTLLWQFQRK